MYIENVVDINLCSLDCTIVYLMEGILKTIFNCEGLPLPRGYEVILTRSVDQGIKERNEERSSIMGMWFSITINIYHTTLTSCSVK